MHTEYEATFTNIDKEQVRKQLKATGATLEKAEFLQKRVTFNLPKEHDTPDTWVRVRDEQDKITLSLKKVVKGTIEGQQEIELTIDNFEDAVQLLELIGCQKKAYQETKRELWKLEDVEITIDEWPFLEPFVEVEGENEEKVKHIAEKIGFDYTKAQFCSVETLYSEKYGFSEDHFNNHTPKITFDTNPFV